MNQQANVDTSGICTRRRLLTLGGFGLGTAALHSLLRRGVAPSVPPSEEDVGSTTLRDVPAGVKRVIYLFHSGGPSQYETFEHKPVLEAYHGTEMPESLRQGQRITTMTDGQSSMPLVASRYRFERHGRCGALVSELLPYTAKVVDELCFIKAMHTEAINHDQGATMLFTGDQRAGRPSLGAWLGYGLGSVNDNLPTFVVIAARSQGQAFPDRLWGSGFLPSRFQGVKLRSVSDAVPFLQNPPGVSRITRRQMLDDLGELNQIHHDDMGDPEIAARIAQYELAFRMQTSIPEVLELNQEPEATFRMYGPESRIPGSYAASCILARRLAERGVRFIQVAFRAWDHHLNLPSKIVRECNTVDQPSAALIWDLKQRGMLEDTLVVWGGEFGRTAYCQGRLTNSTYGRDHHPYCFTMWLAGGGIKPGFTYGASDDFGYNCVQDPVHIHDLNATILHSVGLNHERLTYRHQGRDYRLTDVAGRVVNEILA